MPEDKDKEKGLKKEEAPKDEKSTGAKVLDLLEKQGKAIEALSTRADETEKELKKTGAPQYVDENGKPVAGGPYVIKGEVGRGSRPLRISNVIRSISNKDWSYAKEEREIHDRMLKVGYLPQNDGGFLFPLAPEHIPDDHADLREEVSKRMSMESVDHGEVAWLIKRFPTLAPAFELMYKDLKLGDDSLGGFLVPVTQGDRIIDLLRNRVVVQRAGATEISLPPSGNLTWPRTTTDPSFGFDDPDRTADITVTDAKFGVLRFQAKNLTGAVAIPNDLIRFSSPSVEAVVRQMMAANAAVVEDRAYITGLGTSFEPKGVINHDTSAIAGTQGKVTLHVASTIGTNGDTFEPEDVALMMAKQEESSDPDMSTAWLMRPLMWATILNKRADAVVAGDKAGPFMFPVTRGDVARAPQKMLLDIPVLTTKQIPNDRVKGSGTDLTLIILANWRRAIIARSGAMELAASEHVRFLRDQTVIKGIMRVDFGLEYEESFVFVDDVIIGA